MPDKNPAQLDPKLRKIVSDAQMVDFEKLGNMVAEITPQLVANPGIAADYAITAATSVLHIAKIGGDDKEMDSVENLKKVTGDMEANLVKHFDRVLDPAVLKGTGKVTKR